MFDKRLKRKHLKTGKQPYSKAIKRISPICICTRQINFVERNPPMVTGDGEKNLQVSLLVRLQVGMPQ